MTATQSATRAEVIAAVIRRAIQGGEYVSGERLVELTLAQKFSVSQNTVRDALRILEGEGWVVKHARRGAYVRSYTADEAAELYVLWATLEGLAVRWIIEVLTRTDLNRLRQLLAQAQLQVERGDVRGSIETLFTFHETIGHLCGKPQTANLLHTLHNQVRLLETLRQMRAPRNLPQQRAQITAYQGMLAAMEGGDADVAQQIAHDLIGVDCSTLLPLLAVSV
jgi:DNA-binding GntR family transcriptional regulator